MGDRVRVQFPVPDIYFVCNQPAGPQTNSAFHPSGVGKWVPASAGKTKAGMVHSVSGWTRGVQVKLWDPLRTRAIPEHLRGVITTRRYTNPRLPLPYLIGRMFHDFLIVTHRTPQSAGTRTSNISTNFSCSVIFLVTLLCLTVRDLPKHVWTITAISVLSPSRRLHCNELTSATATMRRAMWYCSHTSKRRS